jgi:RNA polymerase sigma factor (sigma-70 family)
MTDSIEQILKEITPRLRAELNKLGYPAYSPGSDDLLQESIVRLWKALKNRDGKLEYINSYAKKVVFSVYINEVNRIRKENHLIFCAGGQRRNEYEAAGGRADPSGPVKEAVMASLSALPEAKRRVIRLHIDGFSLSEIAVLDKLSYSRVRDYYYRGIEELRRRLARKGIG